MQTEQEKEKRRMGEQKKKSIWEKLIDRWKQTDAERNQWRNERFGI